MEDYYNLIGVPFDATGEEIRVAYFEAARQNHPDANPTPQAKEDFLKIQEAYEVLSNPQKREEYNLTLPKEYHEKSALEVNVRYSRHTVPLLGEPQIVYALLELTCTAETDPLYLPPVNLCLVVDRSTSMQGNRIGMVKENIRQLLHLLRPQDILSIVTFSDRAEVLLHPTQVNGLGESDLGLNKLATSGATEIFQGLEAGYELIQQGSNHQINRQIVLLTDGHTYGDEESACQLAQIAAEQGIFINALGFGNEWNDIFLDRLSAIGGGNSSYVVNSKDLYTFFDMKLRNLESLYARSITLEFESDPGVQLRYAFRLRPEISPLPVGKHILLGGLNYGKSLSLILEFYLSPMQDEKADVRLAKGKITMDIPSMPISKNRVLVEIKRPVHVTLNHELPPPAIIEALSRLSLYRLQEKARQDVAAGDIIQASRHLHHLATHLLARGDRSLAQTVMMEVEYLQKNRSFSTEGDKRIKYGTCSLLTLAPPES